MTIQVPGRILSADEDLTGTSPGLDALRWTVIVRDDRACDFLGDGRPKERLTPQPDPTAEPDPASPPAGSAAARNGWAPIVAGVLVLLGAAALAVYRSRR